MIESRRVKQKIKNKDSFKLKVQQSFHASINHPIFTLSGKPSIVIVNDSQSDSESLFSQQRPSEESKMEFSMAIIDKERPDNEKADEERVSSDVSMMSEVRNNVSRNQFTEMCISLKTKQ